jgi:hypothetical protein
MAGSGPTWSDPLVVATLILAGVTLVLGGGTLAMAWYTRRSVRDAVKAREVLAESVDAARLAAQAGTRQAEGTEQLVRVTAESMQVISRQAASTEELAGLTRREARPLLVYSDGPLRVEPVPGSDTHMRCDVTLRNYGGFAIVDEGTLLGLGGSMRATPDLVWQGSSIARRLVPPGDEIEIRGGTQTRPQPVPETSSPPAIYVRVRYTDRHGEQPTITYLCLWEDPHAPQRWQVVGQAFDLGDGRPFEDRPWLGKLRPSDRYAAWPAHGETWPGQSRQFW